MNAIRIKWPTGVVEPRADIRSKDAVEQATAREQARTMRQLVCNKA